MYGMWVVTLHGDKFTTASQFISTTVKSDIFAVVKFGFLCVLCAPDIIQIQNYHKHLPSI